MERIRRRRQREFIKIYDYVFDLRHGTDTATRGSADRLNAVGPNVPEATGYGAVILGHFRRMFEAQSLPVGSVFVDLGSGKGRALLLAAELGFRRAVGVEFAEDFCEIARRNVEIWKERRAIDATIEVVHADVVEYQIRNDENVFFLFNPFSQVIVEKVVENILSSLRKAPRKVWVFYYASPGQNAVEDCGVFRPVARFNFAAGHWWTFPGPGRQSTIYEVLGEEPDAGVPDLHWVTAATSVGGRTA